MPANRVLKNVGEAAKTRQKRPKKRSLLVVNEHFEAVFNAVLATQVVFQRPVKAPSAPQQPYTRPGRTGTGQAHQRRGGEGQVAHQGVTDAVQGRGGGQKTQGISPGAGQRR